MYYRSCVPACIAQLIELANVSLDNFQRSVAIIVICCGLKSIIINQVNNNILVSHTCCNCTIVSSGCGLLSFNLLLRPTFYFHRPQLKPDLSILFEFGHISPQEPSVSP